jgi:hypothetical protein
MLKNVSKAHAVAAAPTAPRRATWEQGGSGGSGGREGTGNDVTLVGMKLMHAELALGVVCLDHVAVVVRDIFDVIVRSVGARVMFAVRKFEEGAEGLERDVNAAEPYICKSDHEPGF